MLWREDFHLQNGYIDTSGLLQATSCRGLPLFIQLCIIYDIPFRGRKIQLSNLTPHSPPAGKH